MSTFLFLWVFGLNTLGFIPKIINYRNFHKARVINDTTQLKTKMIEIFTKRIYKLSLDFGGMSIISHFITFIVSIKYFFFKKHEIDVDFYLFIYSIIFQLRVVYSLHRYKKYFFRSEELNPFGLTLLEFGSSEFKKFEDGKDIVDCSVCWKDYKDKDQLGAFPCEGKHTFHLDCINNWLKVRFNCPVCRQRLV